MKLSKPKGGQRLAPTWRGLIFKISLVAALVVAAAVAQVAYDLWRGYERQLGNAERDGANLVRLLDEQTARTFQSIDLTLRAASDAIARLPQDMPERDRAIYDLLVGFMPQLPYVRSLFIVDREGAMSFVSTNFPATPFDNRERDYFQDLSKRAQDGLYIGKPVLSRITRQWFISAGRRLENAAGEFDGIILAAIDPGYFETFYKSIDVGQEGRLGLYLADGTLMVRSPRDDALTGVSFAKTPLFEHVAAAPAGVFHTAASGNELARIFSYRRLEQLPLVVCVALSTREVLKDWYANLFVYIPVIGAFVLFIGVLMWFFVREMRQRESLSVALRDNEERLRLALESSNTGTWTWDRASDRSVGDDSVLRIFGVAQEDYPGTGEAFLRSLHPDDRETVSRAIDGCVAEGASYDVVYRIYRGDGAIRWIHSRGEPVRGDDGQVSGLIGVCSDITALRQAQDALAQSQRLEIVSRMTGGIAHDFNNLLQVVLGNAEILIDGLRENPSQRRWADMIKIAAERAAELTRRLMAFARRQMLEPAETDINRLLLSITDDLRRTLGDCPLVLDLADDLWPAMVDPAQLESAVLNLAVNARDAMKNGGRLMVATANRVLEPEDCLESDGLVPGNYATVSIVDSGIGMTPDVLRRCCEPFFTTKEVGEGSGLGLSMVYGFVKQSDGHLTISSRPGAGTTVILYLPCAEDTRWRPAQPFMQDEAAKIGSAKTVLVVEDDLLVRGYVCQEIVNLGYAVIECADGNAALLALKRGACPDLLFSDIRLPAGLDGVALAGEARRMLPSLAVLLTSGDASGSAAEESRRAGYDLLAKPYRREELASALRRNLGVSD